MQPAHWYGINSDLEVSDMSNQQRSFHLPKWLWILVAIAIGLFVLGGIALQVLKKQGWETYNPSGFYGASYMHNLGFLDVLGVDPQGDVWVGGDLGAGLDGLIV